MLTKVKSNQHDANEFLFIYFNESERAWAKEKDKHFKFLERKNVSAMYL